MKISELLNEAKMNPNIRYEMEKQGYKFLGHGQDQDAYLAPNGTILKIFGYEKGSNGLPRSQQSFVDFADYCMKNSNNIFLPNFFGWERFEFDGEYYLQISCERLFDLDKHNMDDVGRVLEVLASYVENRGVEVALKNLLNYYTGEYSDDYDNASFGQFLSLIGGEKNLSLLANTIHNLVELANTKGYDIDLHQGNFMLGSDGEIVINDPFFTGSFRSY